MKRPHSFSAPIEEGDMGGAFVTIPFDVEAAFGKKRVKIKATFDGVPYQGSLTRMGTDCHLLLVRKDIRAAIGKKIGDVVAVTVEEDTDERKVVLPDEFAATLESHPKALEAFRSLSYTHQREYVMWIAAAKKEETRQRRIEKGIKMLLDGVKHP